jgi:macrolide transport system ATP-binding/permease protein
MKHRTGARWSDWLSSRRDKIRADLDSEIGYHFEESVKKLVAQGLSRDDAVRETRRRFGDVKYYRRKLERIDRNRAAEAASRSWGKLMGVLQDVRYGARVLILHRSFTLVAVLTLALGIGANTAIFSVVNSALIRPLNMAEPERLVTVFTSRSGGQLHGNTSYPDYLDYKEQTEVLSGLVAYTYAPMAVRGSDQLAVVWGQLVSWDYFSVLGVEPRLGRAFLPEEDETFGARAVIVLSHGTWQDRFGSDPEIVGKMIRINDYPFTVIGVAPEGFTGLASILAPAVWAPLAMAEQALPFTPNVQSRVDPWLQLVGRLRPGVTKNDARASLNLLAANLVTTYPDLNAGKGIVVEELDGGRLGTPEATGGAKSLLAVLLGVVGVVLLVACFNVANLQLAKAVGRRREIALRFSLGASRWRIVRQLLMESFLLALIAGGVGLGLGILAVDALQVLQPRTEFPLDIFVALDGRVLGFTLVVALSTGLLFGLAPALQVLRGNQSEALKDQSFSASQSTGRARLQNSLVVAQVALSLVLLAGAGLFVRSLRNTLAIDPGFDLRDGVVLPVNLGFTQYGEAEGTELRQRILDRAASLPGVESAALSAFLPLGLVHGHHDVAVDGYEPAPDEYMLVKRNMVSARYFETMGIRVLSGRPIDERDGEETEPVAVVNEAMAQRFWPDQDPIGRTVQADLGTTYTVIGVIEDGKYAALPNAPEPYLAIPLGQGEYAQRVNLVVQTSGDPNTMVERLSAEVRRLAPNVPQSTVLTMPQYLEYSVGVAKGLAMLVGAFGLLALVLATVGLYGVMSYTVSQRTREFGVRMALGATQTGIAKMVLRRGFRTTVTGVAIGIVLASVVTRVLSGFLYGVNTLDPVVFTLVPATLLAIGQLASYLPAHLASRTDPVEVMRTE